MNKTRIAAKWFAGIAVVSTLFISAATAPAQAKDTGWDSITPTSTVNSDTGWD